MAALPTKTPVSLLQELCVRKGITPKYDLVQIEGAVHEPTFKYRVTVAEFSDFGSGQSKKKAKHSAAKAILDKLLGSQAFGGALSETATDGTIVANHVTGNSYDDGIQGNPIGTLQELCMSRRWPPPIYDLNAEEGLPHERQFTINCIVGKYKEPGNGAGKSKKVAKRQAAYKMLQKLKDVPLEPNSVGIAAEDLATRFAGLKVSKIPTVNHAHSQKVSHFHKALKNTQGKKLIELQTAVLNGSTSNYIQLLQEISMEQNFEITYVDIEEKTMSGKHQCLCQLSTLPVAVCYGVGINGIEAQKDAAHNALEYLKIMTKT